MQRRYFVQLFILLLLFNSCKKENNTSCALNDALYSKADYPIGVAVEPYKLIFSTPYYNITASQFNRISPENCMKFEYIHPNQNQYYWDEMDSLVQFCKTYSKSIHGHTLIWHKQLPEWVLNFSGDESAWESLLKDHIQTIMLRYKQNIYSWDVVNEAFNEDGTLRNSIWRTKLGDRYIELAFQYAREADPNAKLFYNDYNLESNPNKRTAVLQYFDNMKNRGIEIDGIGMQMHVSLYSPDVNDIALSFQEITEHGYLLHISELDIAINIYKKLEYPSKEKFLQQADYLGKIVANYNQLNKQYQFGITFWGVSDADTWLVNFYNRPEYPLLFDNLYAPKSAYCKLLDVL